MERALGDRAPEMYDTLYIFGYIIAFSILPAFLAWMI